MIRILYTPAIYLIKLIFRHYNYHSNTNNSKVLSTIKNLFFTIKNVLYIIKSQHTKRGVRVVDGAILEGLCGSNSTVGSNPIPSVYGGMNFCSIPPYCMQNGKEPYLLTGHLVGRGKWHCKPVKAKQSSFCRFNKVGKLNFKLPQKSVKSPQNSNFGILKG